MKIFLIKKLKSKKGLSESLYFICAIGGLMVIFYILAMAFVPFIVNADLDSYTKTLVRQIETHGAIDAEIEQFANNLADIYGIDPEITYDADFIAGTNHIQIRDDFKVTVKTDSEIVLLNGSFFEPVTLTIPLNDEEPGISEVLWK